MKKIAVVFVTIVLISIALFVGMNYLHSSNDVSGRMNSGDNMDTTSKFEESASETEGASEAEQSAGQLGLGVRGDEVGWIYNGHDPILEPEGSKFVLKSAVRKQGEKQADDVPLNLGFNGTFNVTVNSAKIFDSPSDAQLDWNQMPITEEKYTTMLENPAFLLVDITLENVDAAQEGTEPYAFSASMFDVKMKEDFLPENNSNGDYFSKSDSDVFGQYYFSQSIVSNDPTAQEYYTFILEPGNTIDIQIGFFAERSFCTDQSLVLKLGAISDNLLGILLNPTE